METNAATYIVRRARSPAPLTVDRAEELAERWRLACTEAGLVPWGTFAGLFGLRTDELLLVAAGATRSAWPTIAPLERIDEFIGEPTARPLTPEPQQTAGVYVFRTFEIAATDVEPFVRLSAEAWESFEDAPDYLAEPRALFRGAGSSDAVRMLLITWYADLGSWERSRQPAPAARENFLRRAQLTRWALPIATRLV